MRRVLVVVSLFVGVVVLLVGASGAGSGSLQQRWVIRDLGTLGGVHGVGLAINERGRVAGTSRTASGERHVFLWRDGGMLDLGRYGSINLRRELEGPGFVSRLGPGVLLSGDGQVAWAHSLGGPSSLFTTEGKETTVEGVVMAMNEAGQLAGWQEGHAMVWENGRGRDLGVMGEARALNDRGVVVGVGGAADPATGEGFGFLWKAGRVRAVGSLGTFLFPVAVNDRGQVLCYGFSLIPDVNLDHGWLWEDGAMRDLGPLGENGRLSGMNESGQVIGWREGAGGIVHAFLWQEGKMTDLGTLPGDKTSAALAINERGQVVGRSMSASGFPHAFVWQEGVMTSIGRGRASSAWDINEEGEIVGWRGTGTTDKGNRVQHAVLWTLKRG
jgi:probable HAF family extracellular repeat protein